MLPTVHEAFVSFAVENDADSEIPPWLERTSSDLPPASDGNVTFTFSSAISARENLANFAWFVASPRPKSSNSAGTAAVQAWLDTIHRPDFAALPDAIEREDSAEDESDERIRVVYVGGPGTWDHAFEDESNLVLVSRFSSLFKAARGLSADIDIVLINLDATQGTTDREATRFFEEIAQSHPHIRTIAWSRKTEAREKPSVADSITRIHAALFLQKPPSMEDLPTILHRVLADESPSASAEAAARPIPSQVQFSPREREILLLAARGLTTKEISRRMGLTTSLTYHILYRAREKMRAVTQTETGTSQHTH
jgi:DNA-binding NarL/FixJ family response regulator